MKTLLKDQEEDSRKRECQLMEKRKKRKITNKASLDLVVKSRRSLIVFAQNDTGEYS